MAKRVFPVPSRLAPAVALAMAAALTAPRLAFAQSPGPAKEGPALAAPSPANDRTLLDAKRPPDARPPAQRQAYIQYGVAFTIEGVAAPGPICDGGRNACILGSGGGISIRVGLRATNVIYVGGAYEFSKQDPNNLYRLAILQQGRGELRYYFPTGHEVVPFALLGAGVAGYGDEWSVDAWGPAGTLGAGLEVDLSGGVVLGVAVVYRAMALGSFVDSGTHFHDGGVSHLFGLELALEAQEGL